MGRHKGKRKLRKPAGPATPLTDTERLAAAELPHTPETELAIVIKHAAEANQPDILSDFIELQKCRGQFQVNEQDSKGLAALHFACFFGKLDLATIVVKNGADTDMRDDLGFTPLFYVTGRYPNPEIATYLLEEGNASVNLRSNTGVAPIHGCALQGNLECLKVLLKHGADPRCEDEDGITPMDAAESDKVKALIHSHLRKLDSKAEKQMSSCEWCSTTSDEASSLKRCAKCRVTLYCSRECQIKHWKEGFHKDNCQGFIMVNPDVPGHPFKSMINTNFQKGTYTVYDHNRLTKEVAGYLKKKDFIVKVQVPAMQLPGVPALMAVYNEDRKVNGFISPGENGYASLRRYIMEHGYMGLKAYFWAEFADEKDSKFKVFHGKAAPFQNW